MSQTKWIAQHSDDVQYWTNFNAVRLPLWTVRAGPHIDSFRIFRLKHLKRSLLWSEFGILASSIIRDSEFRCVVIIIIIIIAIIIEFMIVSISNSICREESSVQRIHCPNRINSPRISAITRERAPARSNLLRSATSVNAIADLSISIVNRM